MIHSSDDEEAPEAEVTPEEKFEVGLPTDTSD